MAEQIIQTISGATDNITQTGRKRIVCLYRASTVGQVEKDDIPMQKQYCREFCRQHPGWEIVKEFSEKGVSGLKVSAKDRDAIQEIQRMALQGEYHQKQREYQDLRAETLRVIQGNSRFSADLLNSLIDETAAQLKDLEGQMQAAEQELKETVSGAEQVRQEYAQLMGWAELYDNCSFEAKKMIVAQFVKAARVKRGYEVDIEFNVSFEEFQALYPDPEAPTGHRGRKGAGEILALAENV